MTKFIELTCVNKNKDGVVVSYTCLINLNSVFVVTTCDNDSDYYKCELVFSTGQGRECIRVLESYLVIKALIDSGTSRACNCGVID